jgi:hypothetical protein
VLNTKHFKPSEIEKVVVEVCHALGRVMWKDLRVRSTMAKPCRYTDSEFNQAIKHAIQKGTLCSDCRGTKIEKRGWVWPA